MAKRNKYADMFTLRSDGRYQAKYTDETGKHTLYDRDPERLFLRLQEARTKSPDVPTFRQIAEGLAAGADDPAAA